MEDHEKEEELHRKLENALGPAQKLIILKELIQLYKSENPTPKINEVYLEVLHHSLEISNADPALWHEFGEVALLQNRIPLALYAFNASVSLSPIPPYLYSYALTLALTHDYINSLVICNYLLDSFNYQEANKVKEYIKVRLTGEGSSDLFIKRELKPPEDPEKVITKKIWNLYSLCVAVRQVATNKEGSLCVFEKGEPGSVKKKKDDKYLPPECRYWDIIEKYKRKILESSNHGCFGFVCEKVFKSPFLTSKVYAVFEPEIAVFLNTSVNYRKISSDLIRLLCKNTPRPSALLSGEVSEEILKIYNLTKDSLELQDEYLTLLEIAISDTPDLINELRVKLCGSYVLNKELDVRCFFALAVSYFKRKDTFDKNPEGLVQNLYNTYVYANKALEGIKDESWYLWWCDRFVNKNVINKLIEEIAAVNDCVEVEKSIKGGVKLAQDALGFLDRLTKALIRLYKDAEPHYYWRKIKLILKNIGNFKLTPEQNQCLCQCLSRYISVLLFNMENGGKINNDHDIKGLLIILTDNVNYSTLPPSLQSQFIVSLINLLRHCSKYLNQIPFLFKKIFKDLDPKYLPVIFSDFHGILDAKSDLSFHLNLCKQFEKICFSDNSENKHIIYKWIYGLSNKKCTCKAKYPSSPLALPDSSNKLSRITSYLSFSFYKEEDFPSDPQILAFFSELYNKEPKFFVTCKLKEHKKIEELLATADFHTNCCSESARDVAKNSYKRFAIEIIGSAMKKEAKEAQKAFKSAVEVLLLGLNLDPTDAELWCLAGLAFMWKWIICYYDVLQSTEQQSNDIESVDWSLKCFDKSLNSTNSDLLNYSKDNKAWLLYLLQDCDKDKKQFVVDNLPFGDTEKIYTIHLLITKKAHNFDIEIEHPVQDIIRYSLSNSEDCLNKLEESDDIFSKYYEGKIKKNWIDLFDKNIFSLDLPCKNLKIHRDNEIWKLRRKIGVKCLDIAKQQNKAEKIIEIVSKFSALCNRGKKNKEVVEVICAGIKILYSCLEMREVAEKELDKNKVLNSKEKQKLKLELEKSS